MKKAGTKYIFILSMVLLFISISGPKENILAALGSNADEELVLEDGIINQSAYISLGNDYYFDIFNDYYENEYEGVIFYGKYDDSGRLMRIMIKYSVPCEEFTKNDKYALFHCCTKSDRYFCMAFDIENGKMIKKTDTIQQMLKYMEKNFNQTFPKWKKVI